MRIDRWLFFVRLFKSRSLAGEAVTGGKVHVNGERVKPARVVRIGDHDRIQPRRRAVRLRGHRAAAAPRPGAGGGGLLP